VANTDAGGAEVVTEPGSVRSLLSPEGMGHPAPLWVVANVGARSPSPGRMGHPAHWTADREVNAVRDLWILRVRLILGIALQSAGCSTVAVSRKTRHPEGPAPPVPGRATHLVAWRVLQPLEHLLHTLRRPDEHGNRTLFADHLLIAHLVAFFSPALQSLRRLEDLCGHPAARRKYNLPPMPRSTVSDAHTLFDPALLTPLVEDLRRRVPRGPHEPRLDELTRTLLAVDGTFFTLAPRVLWAVYTKPNGTPRQPPKQNQHGNVRVDVHFNVLAGVPETAVVSDGRTPEYRTLVAHLQPNAFYVLDRAYHSYQMMADIVAAGSDFLVRLRSEMQFTVRAEEPLSAADQAAGVPRGQTVQVCGARGATSLGVPPWRLVALSLSLILISAPTRPRRLS